MRKSYNNVLAAFLVASVLWGGGVNGQVALAANSSSQTLDTAKLAVAKRLTDWMQNTLAEKKAIVAVVSRKGGKDLKGRDRTGMAHSGLAVYDPRVQTWVLYQILGRTSTGQPMAELWRMAPVDFFYGQTGYEENALVLIPDELTQHRVYESILDGRAFKLAFTKKYNLLSRHDSFDSLNCNKWLLLTIAAGRSDEWSYPKVLAIVGNGFEPGKVRMNLIEKVVAKQKSNVRSEEVPTFGTVSTVTPESLYESGLFRDCLFATQDPYLR
jgi:hypothetical protein